MFLLINFSGASIQEGKAARQTRREETENRFQCRAAPKAQNGVSAEQLPDGAKKTGTSERVETQRIANQNLVSEQEGED